MRQSRSRVTSVTCIALASALCVISAPAAAADYYLKLDGVEGEAKVKGKAKTFQGQLRADSWSLGATQTSSAGMSGSGRLMVNAALPGCRVGTRYRTAEVSGPPGQFQLSGVTVSSCTIGSIALDYGSIRPVGSPASR